LRERRKGSRQKEEKKGREEFREKSKVTKRIVELKTKEERRKGVSRKRTTGRREEM
jgi:hypothetical protein